MSDRRYYLEDYFGTRSASNKTSACNECGAVVFDTAAHDVWHEHLDAIAAHIVAEA